MEQNMTNTKEASGKPQQLKIPFTNIYATYKAMIDSGETHFRWHVSLLDIGVRQIYEESPDGLIPVNEDHCIAQILKYSHSKYYSSEDPRYLLVDGAQKIVKNWIKDTEPKEIKKFAYKDENELAHLRLDWVKGHHLRTPTPLFDDMGSRLSNWAAIRMFIGSLFFESDRQQYVWIHGEGGDGKSALGRTLHKVFKHFFCAPSPHIDGFWAASFLHKRLAIMTDSSETKMITHQLFKAVSGDDPIEINQKGEKRYTTKIFTKFIFFSNDKPEISSRGSDMRRIIYGSFTPMDPPPTAEEKECYEENLAKELPAFLDQCIYESEENGIRRTIPCDEVEVTELAEDNEQHFQLIYDECLEVGPGEITAGEFRNVYLHYDLTHREAGKFKEWLERKYSITRGQRFSDGKRVYRGLILKKQQHAINVNYRSPTHRPDPDPPHKW